MKLVPKTLIAHHQNVVIKGRYVSDDEKSSFSVAIKFPLICCEKIVQSKSKLKSYLKCTFDPNLRDLLENPASSDVIEKYEREVYFHQLLSPHPNIVKFHQFIKININGSSNCVPILVTEFCNRNDLFYYVQQRSLPLHEKEALHFFHQLIDGLQFCHNLNIIHRDIKLENLFLTIDNSSSCHRHLGHIINNIKGNHSWCNLILKIGDWEFASSFDKNKTQIANCGSLHYAAPEIYYQTEFIGPEVDVWSSAVCLFTMLTRRMPFVSSTSTHDGMKTCITNKNIFLMLKESKIKNPNIIDLLFKMFDKNCKSRISINDILNHPSLNKN